MSGSSRARDTRLVATTARLVSFLRDIALARRQRVRDLRDYERDGFVRFLSTLPETVSVDREARPGDVLFEVDRAPAKPPPHPPAPLDQWLDLATLTQSDRGVPSLKDFGPVRVRDADAPLVTRTRPLAEAPEITELYERWLPHWQAWAVRDREASRARAWHDAIFNFAHRLSQQDDQFELVLAVGMLRWRSREGTKIRNHLLTLRLRPEMDAAAGVARIVLDDDASSRLQDRELVDGLGGYEPRRVDHLHERIRIGEVPAPLDEAASELLREWSAKALGQPASYSKEWSDGQDVTDAPCVDFAPAVVFRRRDRASLIGYYDAMLDALSGPQAAAPLGLAQLVTALDEPERQSWLEQQGAVSGEVLGSDPLFPLPANPEQRQILSRLSTNNGVVVQGPPGTGKTHTIANLVAALLAEGQRVLVTSQKAQALRVLRDKLPDEIAQLCVSVTDQGRGGSAELERSVKALSTRHADYDRVAHERLLAEQADRHRAARREVARLTESLRSLREAETYQHGELAPGYRGTLASIVKALRRDEHRCGWMPHPLPSDASSVPPIDAAEAAELISLLAQVSTERKARATQTLPELEVLCSAEQFRAMVTDEAAAHQAARSAASKESGRLESCDSRTLQALEQEMATASAVLEECGILDGRVEEWQLRAFADGLAERELSIWHHLAAQSQFATEAQQALQGVGLRDVTLPRFAEAGTASAGAQLQAANSLRTYLAGGGSLRRHLKPAVQKAAAPLLDGALLDGVPISTVEQLDVIVAVLSAQKMRAALAREWAVVGVEMDEGLPTARSIARIIDNHSRLARILEAVNAVVQVKHVLRRAGVRIAVTSLTDWSALSAAVDAMQQRVAADRATAAIAELAERIGYLVRKGGAPPELRAALAALQSRDVHAYAAALARLADAHREQREQQRCNDLIARVRRGHPGLAALLEHSATAPEWPQRLGSWHQAWAWGLAATFVAIQRQPGREHELAAELDAATRQLQRETARLAALQAWGHCLDRMNAHQAQALRVYEHHMRSVGKGTGRYAARYQSLAREAMREARDAVPAWVMPIDQVLDSMPPNRDSFDVVIVDEASQAGIEALFLLWLAPRVIVVGDDKQCAPSTVTLGELQPIFDKLTSYLPEMPGYLRDAFTPKSSLFDLLQSRFGGVVRLREHFRCMPEIINFSSRQFYADEPLVPLRQFGADRLAPLRTTSVSGAYEEGTTTRLRNEVEARAIADSIGACLVDPAYQGKTFGVVVLQGTGQVQLIHNLLLERLDPKVWDERRLRVGTPPDFQGDERDVIFVSMVIAKRHAAVTSTEWQRRFNVAASRARDQMWLFCSVTPDLLSSSDLRHCLLTYALNPPSAEGSTVPADVTADDRHPDFDSLFEQRVFLRICERGYHVLPQFEVNGRRIDLVVTGAAGRLAVECDGDRWHGTPDQVAADLERELELKRAGWRFWRIRESEFYFDPDAALASLWETLSRLSIRPHDRPADNGEKPAGYVQWQPATLSSLEGWDGMEGDNDNDLDRVTLLPRQSPRSAPAEGSATRSAAATKVQAPSTRPRTETRSSTPTPAPQPQRPRQEAISAEGLPIKPGRSITTYTRGDLKRLFVWLIKQHPEGTDADLIQSARETLNCPDEDSWVFKARMQQGLQSAEAVSVRRTRPATPPPPSAIASSDEVRQWARTNGYTVGERSALGGDIIARYNLTHPRRPFPPGR